MNFAVDYRTRLGCLENQCHTKLSILNKVVPRRKVPQEISAPARIMAPACMMKGMIGCTRMSTVSLRCWCGAWSCTQ